MKEKLVNLAFFIFHFHHTDIYHVDDSRLWGSTIYCTSKLHLYYVVSGIPCEISVIWRRLYRNIAWLSLVTFENGEDYNTHRDLVSATACDAGDGKFSVGLMVNR